MKNAKTMKCSFSAVSISRKVQECCFFAAETCGKPENAAFRCLNHIYLTALLVREEHFEAILSAYTMQSASHLGFGFGFGVPDPYSIYRT